MHRIWRMRLAVAVAALGVVPAVSGCVVISSSSSLEQIDVIGDKPIELGMCASGSPGCPLGRSGAPAVTGSGQVLFGVLVSGNTRLPATLASSITLGDSPSYAAELQRLSPAPPGKAWRGFISPTINYDTSSTFQTFTVRLLFQLQRGADGSPFSGPFETSYVVGGRMVTAAAPASRPVSCGPSLTALYDEDPSPTSDVWNVCSDSDGSSLSTVRDLGILRGASETAPQGGLAHMPFTVRYAGPPTSQVTFRLSASSSLPGALFAVTPATIVPLPGVANTTAQVGIGVPASARPGPYEVTLTALVNGQIRTSVGTLRVTAAPGAAAAGGAAARLKLTTILPHRLSARVARRRGIVLLIGATKAGPARVQLFQGRAKKPKASKRVRLRVPGPVKVVLKSAKLRKGPYRVVIRADGRNFVRRGVLVK